MRADNALLLREPTAWGVRLILNRPDKLNAISAELRDALVDAIADATADERVRVVAIAGAGRAFCSGYDLSEAAPPTAWTGATSSPATSPPRSRSGPARSR
jgi:2-(1,2-epoxy-1,2-dihydrophenyl)acetyl-CoA isomerase